MTKHTRIIDKEADSSGQKMSGKKTNLLLICLLTLFNLYVYVSHFKNLAVFVYSDSANYAVLARRYAEFNFDRAIHAWWLPFYPFLGGIAYHFTQNAEQALLYVSILSGVLIVIPVFLLMYEVTRDRLISAAAGLLVSFNPSIVKHVSSLLVENLYTFMLTLSIYLAVITLKYEKYYLAAILGISFGLAFLTRNEAIVFLFIYLLFGALLFVFKLIQQRKWSVFKDKLVKLELLTLICFILTLTPYYGLLSYKFGYIGLKTRDNAAKNSYNPVNFRFNNQTTYAQDVWSVDTPNFKSPFFSTAPKPRKFDVELDDLINGSRIRFSIYMKYFRADFSQQFLLFVLFGYFASLIFFFWTDKKLIFLSLLPILGSFVIMPFLPGAERRYLLWIYPYFYIFLSLGIYIARKIAPHYVLKILIYLLFLIFLYKTLNTYIEVLPNVDAGSRAMYDSTGYKEVGEYIKSLDVANPRIMSRREAISFYAGGETIFTPGQHFSKKELYDYLKIWKVNYIVANIENIGDSEGMMFLMRDEKLPGWVKPVKVFGEGKWRIIVYEFLNDVPFDK